MPIHIEQEFWDYLNVAMSDTVSSMDEPPEHMLNKYILVLLPRGVTCQNYKCWKITDQKFHMLTKSN